MIKSWSYRLLLAFMCFSIAIVPLAYSQNNSSASLSKLTPTQKVQQYLKDIRSIPKEDGITRQQAIEAFANLTYPLSARYGKSNININEREWIAIFSEGFKKSPKNPAIVLSLARLHINKKQYENALDIISSFQKTNPCHEASAWLLHAREKIADQKAKSPIPKETPEIDVHFCVITSNPKAHKKATLDQLKQEVKILNTKFVTYNRKPIIHFKFKSASFYADIKNSDDKLAAFGNSKEAGNTDEFTKLFNSCTDKKIRDPYAINFYIYDSHNDQRGFGDVTSHGRRNSNWPYVLIDWERLNNNIQNPEAHEMGHSFGKSHLNRSGLCTWRQSKVHGSGNP